MGRPSLSTGLKMTKRTAGGSRVHGLVAGATSEELESRRMLSAVIDHRVLVIEGTRRAGTVEITRAGGKSVSVNVNGAVSTFAFKQFGKIRVVLGKGDDYVLVGTGDRPIEVAAVVD